MRTYNCDLDKIHKYTKPIAVKWLEDHNIYYDDIKFGKEWCGPNGYYVDDKNLHLEEFEFKFSGPFSDKTFDVIVPFYNEEGNVTVAHSNMKKLERLLFVKNYIYIDNGSVDETGAILQKLSEIDDSIKLINIQENIGYGNGFKEGFKESSADYILTNHADMQFDPYSYFMMNFNYFINNKDTIYNVFPRRINRPFFDNFNSKILRFIISILKFRKIYEFNGQPKIIKKTDIFSNIDKFPNDFLFDLKLYLSIEDSKKVILPVVQQDRSFGISSWSKGFTTKFNLFMKYIFFAITNK